MIGQRVKEIRKRVGLTQADFAKKIHLTRSSLANIETGQVKVTERNIKTISSTFGISLEWLKTGKGDMIPKNKEDKELVSLLVDILSGENKEIKEMFLTIAQLNEVELEIVSKMINGLSKKSE